MRVQLSLDVKDNNLVKNFIEPYKQYRYLSKVIIKCLSAYYYNKDVRLAIEGTETNGVEEELSKLRLENEELKKKLLRIREEAFFTY